MNSQKMLEALKPMLMDLIKTDKIRVGCYIDYDNPCLMILDGHENVEKWFPLDFETYKMLREFLEYEDI